MAAVNPAPRGARLSPCRHGEAAAMADRAARLRPDLPPSQSPAVWRPDHGVFLVDGRDLGPRRGAAPRPRLFSDRFYGWLQVIVALALILIVVATAHTVAAAAAVLPL